MSIAINLIGLDPSYTRTGICVIKDKSIYFETVSEKIGEKQFENVVHAAQSVVKQLRSVFNKYGEEFDLIHESPLPCSSMSPALYALDTLIYNEFESHIRHTYNPSTLKSKIHGHKYEKKDSVELAMKYISILQKKGYEIKSLLGTKKKIPHDCCEAFLYCHLWLKELGHSDFQFDNTEDIKVYRNRMKELKKREKALLSGPSDITI